MATELVGILPLIVILGPTASGKTALAVELAQKYNGEIICADSRTIYREANIGTAKPSVDDQARVPHWGLDLINPDETYSAAQFKQYAVNKIAEIRSRGHVPFLVGGTGLYIDAVVFDYQFGPKADANRRAELTDMSIELLHEYCAKNSILLPENAQNKRYVIRAIEQDGRALLKREQPISGSVIVGITTNKNNLRTRMAFRTEQLLEHGVVEEAKQLGEKYGWHAPALSGNIYRLAHAYLSGNQTLDEVKEKNTTLDWRLAKRQLTWFRRNKFIQWYSLTDAYSHVNDYLASQSKS